MISQGRGQLCLPVLPEIARRLNLVPMVERCDVDAPKFTIPLDHVSCRSGISPEERATTIRAICDPSTTPADFEKPGHVFPLIAQEHGVLERAGHTEATIDLVRLAGLGGAGILCEICSRDGRSMARGSELKDIASELNLPIITIDDLIDFRRQLEDVLEQAAVIPYTLPAHAM